MGSLSTLSKTFKCLNLYSSWNRTTRLNRTECRLMCFSRMNSFYHCTNFSGGIFPTSIRKLFPEYITAWLAWYVSIKQLPDFFPNRPDEATNGNHSAAKVAPSDRDKHQSWHMRSGSSKMSVEKQKSHLDVVKDELMSLFCCGHLAVSDGLPQGLLGNKGVQVQDRGQAAVQADELFFVGAEVDWGQKGQTRTWKRDVDFGKKKNKWLK